MKHEKIHVSENHAGVDHSLRWDGGRQIEWVAPDGSVRIPDEERKEFRYPGVFTAAGRAYPCWKALCVKQGNSGYLWKDIYGREVFCLSERFPCFDSYDYANENRYYHWFFIKANGKLTRVYYADERDTIQVTEDVRSLENRCREPMQETGWLE